MASLLSDFYPYIEIDTHGISRPLLDQTLQLVIDDFLRSTWVCFEWIDPVVTAEDVKDYELENPPGKQIIGIVKIEEDGSVTSKRYGFHESTSTLWLENDPDTGDTLQVMAALTCPLSSSAIYPDMLSAHYREAVANGAKGKLLFMPGKAWSNPEFGQYFWRRYMSERSAVKVKVNRLLYGQNGIVGGQSVTHNGMRVRARSFI